MASPAMSPQPERIGKYEIKRLLGEGATGSVYLAADPFGERDVALKVMKKRFCQNEAALAGKLRHPHIVSILDAGVEPVHYLVMELVEGAPLSRYCDRDALLEPAQIVGLAYKASKALEFANSVGVVHGDIKPANILVHGELDIKVSDFGMPFSGASPAYSSPERVNGETVDFRADIYSLGAVTCHLLTGRRPLDGAHASELMENAPKELDRIVARAMAKSRDERYSSWEEFGGALAGLLALGSGAAKLSEAEKFAAARRLKFFAGFKDAELWEAVRPSAWRLHRAGEELIREDMPDEHFYIIASGLLKVTRRGKLLNAVSPGECVGEMAYARRDGRPRTATVTAVEASWAMRLRVSDIDTLSAPCQARFNAAFLAIMAERLSMLGGRLTA